MNVSGDLLNLCPVDSKALFSRIQATQTQLQRNLLFWGSFWLLLHHHFILLQHLGVDLEEPDKELVYVQHKSDQIKSRIRG